MIFHTEFISLCYRDVAAARRWWESMFHCAKARVAPEWDDMLPSDVALVLPGDEEPAIQLCDLNDPENAVGGRSTEHSVLFCSDLAKAHSSLAGKDLWLSEIQDSGGAKYFEIQDPEGNVIEICSDF